jgi:hypothetical protein
MRTKIALALGLVALVGTAVIGCSKIDPRSPATTSGALTNPMAPFAAAAAPPDSNPGGGGPPPGHGPKPPVPAVVFVSQDSVTAGQTGNTQWKLHNSAHQAFTMPWVLTSARNWPGFPKSGTVTLAALGDSLLSVAVAVPDTAASGGNGLVMTVTQKDGTTAAASATLQVFPTPDSTSANRALTARGVVLR